MSPFDPLLDGEASEREPKSEPTTPGTLPPDIEAVWGEGRLDGLGVLAANTAHYLIDAWGLDRFRTSLIHQAAVGEKRRQRELERDRKQFRARQKMLGMKKP